METDGPDYQTVTAPATTLVGRRFGRLVVVQLAERGRHTKWLCQCDCGKLHTARTGNLNAGETTSCGCARQDAARRLGNGNNTRHGMAHHPLYQVYRDMLQRCYNPKNQRYARYGGRGITVCAEWRADCVEFFNWAMANGYQRGLSIDRIDNDQGYGPENCRWATAAEQQHNTWRYRRQS